MMKREGGNLHIFFLYFQSLHYSKEVRRKSTTILSYLLRKLYTRDITIVEEFTVRLQTKFRDIIAVCMSTITCLLKSNDNVTGISYFATMGLSALNNVGRLEARKFSRKKLRKEKYSI